MKASGPPHRIAWIAHRYAPCLGGAEGYSRAMVSRFVRAGHSVDVFTTDADDLRYFTDPRRRRVDAASVENLDGARVERLAVRHLPWQRYVGRLLSWLPHWPTRCRYESFMPIVPGLWRIAERYDAVFAVGFPFTGFAYAAYRLARHSGAALVLTPFLHLSTPGDPLHRLYTREHGLRLLREASLVVSPTTLESAFLATRGIPEKRRLVLPMAATKASVTGGNREALRQRLRLRPDDFLVGQLGALDPDKGTCDLVRAVARLRGQGAKVNLALAGQATPAFESFLHQHRALTAGGWLYPLGRIDPLEVPDFYAGIDAFAMPSRTDSFGIVYLEAWANGKPVVAASAGGVVEVVESERTGLLVPFGDVEALAQAIERLAHQPALAARLGQAGLSRVANDRGWDERFEQMWSRVEPLIEEARRSTSPRGATHGYAGDRRAGYVARVDHPS